MAVNPSVWILLKDKNGLQFGDGDPWQSKVPKGEFVTEISKDEPVLNDNDDKKPAPNYRLYRDDAYVVFHAVATDVAPLQEKEYGYLLAIEAPGVRLQEYLKPDETKKMKLDLVVGDVVMFKMKVKPDASVSFTKGVICYIGLIQERMGTHFGIEIQEDKYRGKGTSNGEPYFHCGPKDAVFIAIDMITKRSQFPNSEKPSKDAITTQPTGKEPHGGSNVKGRVRAIDNAQSTSYARAPDPSHQSKFKVGDRVILKSVKEEVFNGVVKWVGSTRACNEGDSNLATVAAVGVDVDKRIDCDKHFPGMCLNITGSRNEEIFKVGFTHTRLFLPEELGLVLNANDYAKQKQKDHALQWEAKEAKKYGLSLEEFRSQKEYFEKANKDKKHEQSHNQQTGMELEEEGGSAGVGNIANRKNENQLTESMMHIQTGQPLSDQRRQEEKRLYEAAKQRNQHDDRDRSDFEFIKGGEVSNVDDNYLHVGSYYAAPQDSDNHQLHANREGLRFQESSSPKVHHNSEMEGKDYRSLPSSRNAEPPRPPPPADLLPSADLPPPNDLPPPDPHHQFTIGSMVRINVQKGGPLYGVLKWVGTVPDFTGTIAGVELEQPLREATDGTWRGFRFFTCPPGRAYFCPMNVLRQDTRYLDEGQVPAHLREDIKNPLAGDTPITEENDTYYTPDLFTKYIGDRRGIQGHHNSCYLDSTVFGLFALSESFDDLLLEEPTEEVGKKVKHCLWKGIVNPLRKYGLARYESVMDLRDSLEEFGRMKGANRDEKDPEEFLNLLFKEVLHINPFLSIKRPFGVEQEYFIQLFFEIDPNNTEVPYTDKLLTQMFHEQQISFTRVPSKLLLQMPRFGKEFKMYNRIIPSLTLDVKPLLDPSARGSQKCYFCLSDDVSHACYTCPKELFNNADPYTYYCSECAEIAHRPRKGHRVVDVEIKPGTGDATMFSKMELLSVICIETSHYVCYTRSGDKWLFHDSMANRLYDMYNIPRVVDVTVELQEWIYFCDNLDRLMNTPAKNIPEYVRRFTQDIYMCVYVNPELDLYGNPEASMPR